MLYGNRLEGFSMLDIKMIRDNTAKVQQALDNRGAVVGIEEFLRLEKERREVLQTVEQLKSQRNTVSQEISKLKKSGQNADQLISEMRGVGDSISELDGKVRTIEADLADIVLSIPNIPHESVPVGADEEANKEVRRWGDVRRSEEHTSELQSPEAI